MFSSELENLCMPLFSRFQNNKATHVKHSPAERTLFEDICSDERKAFYIELNQYRACCSDENRTEQNRT